MLIQKIPK